MDVDTILEMRWTETKSVPFEIEEDMVFASLFIAPLEPQDKPCGCAKRHLSCRTIEGEDDRVRNREKKDLKAAMRSLF